MCVIGFVCSVIDVTPLLCGPRCTACFAQGDRTERGHLSLAEDGRTAVHEKVKQRT
jgi:hypothetical protein